MTTGSERHWITRAKSTTTFRLIRRLGPGDELVEFEVSSEARQKDPSLPTHFDARAIRYHRKGFRPQLLLTSLMDEKRYPAAELRVLYHERWEIELGFGEIKTDMLERLETIRSKSPAAVAQELWGGGSSPTTWSGSKWSESPRILRWYQRGLASWPRFATLSSNGDGLRRPRRRARSRSGWRRCAIGCAAFCSHHDAQNVSFHGR